MAGHLCGLILESFSLQLLYSFEKGENEISDGIYDGQPAYLSGWVMNHSKSWLSGKHGWNININELRFNIAVCMQKSC